MDKKDKTNKEFRALNSPFELRSVEENDNNQVVGYVAKFNALSEEIWGFRERIEPGAFAGSILEDDIRALIDHDSSKILGRNKAGTLRLQEDGTGLLATIDLPDTQLARDLKISMQRGDITGASFGFVIVDSAWERSNEQDIHILKKVRLFDVSVVTYPAYPDTSVSVRTQEELKQFRNELNRPIIEAVNQVNKMKLKLAEAI